MKKLQVAKIIADVKGVTIKGSGSDWSIETENESQKTKVLRLLRAEGIPVGGFRCGHGGWVLTENYAADLKEFGDKSSSVHY